MIENELISSSAKGRKDCSCDSRIAWSCFAARFFIRQETESRLGQPGSQALSFSSVVEDKKGNGESEAESDAAIRP